MMKLRLAFPLACAAALFAIGCGGSSFIDANRDNGLAGTWTLDNIAVDGGTAVTCPGTATASDVNIGCSRIQNKFTSDGKYTTTSADGTLHQDGNFTYDRTILTTITGDEDIHAPVSIVNNSTQYQMRLHQYGHSVVYTFNKNL